METLEQKILQAKKLGIKFHVKSALHGITVMPYNEFAILDNLTDDEFEKHLDKILEFVTNKQYLQLLKKYDLID